MEMGTEMRSKSALALAFALLADHAFAATPLQQFLGPWTNAQTGTTLHRLGLRIEDNIFYLSAHGDCEPNDCFWGVVNARAYAPAAGVSPLQDTSLIGATMETPAGPRRLLVRMAAPNQLQVIVMHSFDPGDRRLAYARTYNFRRPGPVAPPRPVPPPPLPQESCQAFNPLALNVVFIDGGWKLLDGARPIKNFGSNEAEVRQAHRLIRSYNINQRCRANLANAQGEYWKVGAVLPIGARPGEDCVPVEPLRATVTPQGAQWAVGVAGRAYRVYPTEIEAQFSLAQMQRLGARFACFVGRPDPSMTYWRR